MMSNFSETKSQSQSCTGTTHCQKFTQKYINYYKCGKDSGGASIELYRGNCDISYSNYIDIESTGDSFLVIGYGVAATISKCFFRINGYRYLLGLFHEMQNETINIEDSTFFTEINHYSRYLTTKNVIFDSTKLDYSFVNVPYIKPDFFISEETVTCNCIFYRFSYLLFIIII